MHKVFNAQIVSQKEINQHYRIVSFLPLSDEICHPLPGQFYMIQTSEGTDPLLKRPFSIYFYEKGLLHFLYRIVGRGTRFLSMLGNHKEVQIIGPLGKSYPCPNDDFIAVAGGTGIASINYLLHHNHKKGILYYGARTHSELVLIDNLKSIAKEVIFTTDDGSFGFKGTTLDALKNNYQGLPIYACGPKQMLKALSTFAERNHQSCYVSLEEHMACGIGACLSCVVKTKEGLKSVCKEGAVFDSKEIIWD
ncbi:MAG: dihydroorotate dehydrogenase electron transfer subunit [Thermodesulfovibrionales bacterium]|nr:dihydroorotate dehydrogenase electron transfer subunit [Thermodesulfovibrionales bacterium]